MKKEHGLPSMKLLQFATTVAGNPPLGLLEHVYNSISWYEHLIHPKYADKCCLLYVAVFLAGLVLLKTVLVASSGFKISKTRYKLFWHMQPEADSCICWHWISGRMGGESRACLQNVQHKAAGACDSLETDRMCVCHLPAIKKWGKDGPCLNEDCFVCSLLDSWVHGIWPVLRVLDMSWQICWCEFGRAAEACSVVWRNVWLHFQE